MCRSNVAVQILGYKCYSKDLRVGHVSIVCLLPVVFDRLMSADRGPCSDPVLSFLSAGLSELARLPFTTPCDPGV